MVSRMGSPIFPSLGGAHQEGKVGDAGSGGQGLRVCMVTGRGRPGRKRVRNRVYLHNRTNLMHICLEKHRRITFRFSQKARQQTVGSISQSRKSATTANWIEMNPGWPWNQTRGHRRHETRCSWRRRATMGGILELRFKVRVASTVVRGRRATFIGG